VERRLAAILVADVVGYSKLIGEDEARTLEALNELRDALFEPLVAARGGNVVKRMGDGWIVEYPNVSDAVDCAIEIQTGLANHKIIKLRIGIHTGDVTFRNEDIFGDGVNVAARLESLAEPGQVLISDSAHHSLDGKAGARFVGGETHELKNITRPVAIWRWPANSAPPALNHLISSADRKPTLFVRGFTARADSDDELIATGITDALSVALSSLTGFNYVVAEADADYVVFGIVQTHGERCRVLAQMLDGNAKRQVWAEKYEADTSDLFELQDVCVYRISMSVRSKVFLLEGEKLSDRDKENMSTEEILSFAGAQFYSADPSIWRSIQPLMERILEREPDNFMAIGMAAATILGEFFYGYRKTDPRDVSDAVKWINQALRINANSDFLHMVRACLLAMHEGSIKDAEAAARRSLELNPNYSLGYFALALTQTFAGDYRDGIANAYRAIEADKRHPYLHMFHLSAGLANFGLQDFESARLEFARSNQFFPDVPATLMALATNSWHTGDVDQARELSEQLSRLEPEIRLSTIHFPPFREPGVVARYEEGLRKSGLPE
jgi:adenylate cyclase